MLAAMFDPDPAFPIGADPLPATLPDLQLPIAATATRVVVADDHPLYRQGIVRALDGYGGFAVVAEAADGVAALALIRELEPDIALLDVRMPILDGVDVVQALALHGPEVPVVLLSAFSDRPLVDSALEAGAAAYIGKTEDRDAICHQLATIAGSGATLAPRRLNPPDALVRPVGTWLPRLTRQEFELLQVVAKGNDKLAAARLLDVDEVEVRQRASALLPKLGADSLDAAVRRARALGLIR
jgi:two-component system, NarL family, nitrate/nitrite response regulator NarL